MPFAAYARTCCLTTTLLYRQNTMHLHELEGVSITQILFNVPYAQRTAVASPLSIAMANPGLGRPSLLQRACQFVKFCLTCRAPSAQCSPRHFPLQWPTPGSCAHHHCNLVSQPMFMPTPKTIASTYARYTTVTCKRYQRKSK